MKFEFDPLALQEFYDAIDYYNEKDQDLGDEFAFEVYKGIEIIHSFPLSWPKTSENCRKCIINRFPYSIIYSIDNDIILIFAIMHQHQDPKYWVDRI